MDAALRPWLKESISADLLLGVHWLQEKVNQQEKGAGRGFKASWADLYSDDGSSLIINPGYHREGDGLRLVQIINPSPLVVSDGTNSVHTDITAECAKDISRRYRGHCFRNECLYTIISVRKHSVKCTTYGPPADQLRIALHEVDWRQGTFPQTRKPPVAILSLPLIQSHLAKLSQARAQEHKQYSYSDCDPVCTSQSNQPMPEEWEESQLATQAPNTFAAPKPKSTGASEPDHTNPTAQKKANRDESAKREELLTILGKGGPTTVVPPFGPSKSHRDKTKEYKELAAQRDAEARQKDRPHISQVATIAFLEQRDRQASEGRNSKEGQKNKRVHEADAHSGAEETPSFGQQTSSAGPGGEMVASSSRASVFDAQWLTGWQFDAGTAIASQAQQALLSRSDAWQKPPVGYTNPNCNVPIDIYTEIERLMIKEPSASAPDANAEEGIATQQSKPDRKLSSQAEGNAEDEDDDAAPMSSISWPPSSPIPERPKKQFHTQPELPPDSSLQSTQGGQKAADRPPVSQPSVRGTQDLPSSPPAFTSTVPPEEDTEMEMEMEVEIPHALGEDQTAPAEIPKSSPVDNTSGANGLRQDRRQESIVQVQVTPAAKGKNPVSARESPRTSLREQPSNGLTESPKSRKMTCHICHKKGHHQFECPENQKKQKTGSSQSIIPGTYKTPTSSNNDLLEKSVQFGQLNASDQRPPTANMLSASDMHRAAAKDPVNVTVVEGNTVPWGGETRLHPTPVPAPTLGDSGVLEPKSLGRREGRLDNTVQAAPPDAAESTSVDVDMQDVLPHPSVRPVQGAPSLHSTAVADEIAAGFIEKDMSGSDVPSAKRPAEGSPPRTSSRKSKKQIKIKQEEEIEELERRLGITPQPDLQQVKQDTIAQYREQRASNQPSDFPDVANFPVPDLEGDQMTASLAERLPLMQRAATRTSSLGAAVSERVDKPRRQKNLAVEQMRSSNTPLSLGRSISPPRSKTLGRIGVQAGASFPDEAFGDSRTRIYDLFKEAYPDYSGDVNHFMGQCKKMYELDLEDKMIQKWLWDDYLIRNRTDYKAYASSCLDSGGDIMPYIRFYKDHIQDAIYCKGILNNRHILRQALVELEQETPEDPAENQFHRRGRQALPWEELSSITSGAMRQSMSDMRPFDGASDGRPSAGSTAKSSRNGTPQLDPTVEPALPRTSSGGYPISRPARVSSSSNQFRDYVLRNKRP